MAQLFFASNPVLFAVFVLVMLTLAVEVPYRLGRTSEKLAAIDDDAWNTIQGALLTLVAFMLGLSYAQAQGRFDARRDLVVTEANAIGSTWLRSDQLPPPAAARFAESSFSTRGNGWTRTRNREIPPLYARAIRDTDEDQEEMWRIVSGALRERPTDLGRSLLMTALNETIEVSSEQVAALTHHVPTSAIVFTFILLLVGSVSIGLRFARNKSRPESLSVLYVIALAVVFNLIVDYDRPRVGGVRVPLDALAIQLRSMK